MNVGAVVQVGKVGAFDEHVGWGQLRGVDGAMIGFHCVAITDGTRRIEPDTTVQYRLVPGLHGRWEAAGITPADD